MKKHHRELRKILRRLSKETGVRMNLRLDTKHIHIVTDEGDLVASASSSPKNFDHALDNVEADVFRWLVRRYAKNE